MTTGTPDDETLGEFANALLFEAMVALGYFADGEYGFEEIEAVLAWVLAELRKRGLLKWPL